MSNENRNVPELRFPGFEDEWKNNELGKLLSIISGHSPSYYSEGSEYPLYKVNDLNNNSKFQNYSDLYVEKKHTPLNKKVIIFPKRGAAILLNKVRIINTPGYIDTNLMGLEFNDVNDTEFYYYAILREGLYRIADTSTIPQINNKHILPYKIYSPSYTEKNKLGNFFSKLDRQIELEEQKLAKLEEQKKGYMQKIFSQEFRFKDENGNDYPEWEDKLISDIGKVITGNTPSKKENDYWNSNQYIWVTPTDISNKKNIYTSGYQLSQKGFSKARQLPKNTLLITCIASIGKNAILRIEGSCNQQINAVIPNDNYDVDYLYYAFEDVSKLMKSIAGKTATQIVNKAVFEKLLLNVPIYEEQQKISGFLNKVDILIDKQAQKIDELKLRKQGFLQKMFV